MDEAGKKGGPVRASAPVSELQLFDSTQYCLQVAFLVFQHQSGQPLKHQGHVEHQHRVARRHVTGLLSKTARGVVLRRNLEDDPKTTLDLLYSTFNSICLHSWSLPHLKSALARYSRTSVF